MRGWITTMQTSSFHQEINSKKRVVAMAGISSFKRMTKLGILLGVSIAILALAGCGRGNGPQSFPNEPATPLPPGGGGPPFDSGLLTNGDFEAGVEPWVGNAAN